MPDKQPDPKTVAQLTKEVDVLRKRVKKLQQENKSLQSALVKSITG
jgi:polyhydroxyalkanoate synthesis regulator phasin